MKITAECVPCLLQRILFEVNLVNSKYAYLVLREACGILSNDLSPEISSAELATRVHKRTYEILGSDDPYITIKASAMEVGYRLEERAKTLIAQSENKVHSAILCSIVGNVLDFGIEGGVSAPDELMARFDEIYQEGLGFDEVHKLEKYLRPGLKIVFLTDNCGEIVFDKLLCEELLKYGIRIILVVKGEPILSDAMVQEAIQVGFDKIVDEILTTGDYAVGFNVKNIPEELNNHLKNSDLIISKGMANFEALSETIFCPIMYLLRTKCKPVADALDLPKDLNVAKLIE